jgi:hypothetical protein
MRRYTSAFITAGLAALLEIVGVPHTASAQTNLFQPDIPIPPYNPYPALPGFTPLIFCRPIYSRKYIGFERKLIRSSVAISTSGKH